jgi:hypothetical protein
MRTAFWLRAPEETGDLGSIDVIKTNYSSVHHNFGAGFRRIFRVTRSVSEDSGAIPSLTLRVSMFAVAVVVYATHE